MSDDNEQADVGTQSEDYEVRQAREIVKHVKEALAADGFESIHDALKELRTVKAEREKLIEEQVQAVEIGEMEARDCREREGDLAVMEREIERMRGKSSMDEDHLAKVLSANDKWEAECKRLRGENEVLLGAELALTADGRIASDSARCRELEADVERLTNDLDALQGPVMQMSADLETAQAEVKIYGAALINACSELAKAVDGEKGCSTNYIPRFLDEARAAIEPAITGSDGSTGGAAIADEPEGGDNDE